MELGGWNFGIIPQMSEHRLVMSPQEAFAAEKLDPVFVEQTTEVLRQTSTLIDLIQQFRERRFACDIEQFLLPLFRPLYKHTLGVRELTQTQLGGLGLTSALVDEYFTNMGDQPYIVLCLKYEGQIPPDTSDRFISEAQRLIFTRVKEQLGSKI